MVSAATRPPALRIFALFALLLIAAAPAVLRAQAFDASHLTQPATLDCQWRVQGGDNPAWANPAFDDSAWPLFDPHSSLVDFYRSSRPTIVWYRLHIHVSPDLDGFALNEQSLAHAYEVYGNGELLLAGGSIQPYRPINFGARRIVPLPRRLLASGQLVLALRVAISAGDWTGSNPGLFAANLTLGQQAVLERDNWLSILGGNALRWLDDLLTFCLGIAALVLFLAQRSQREYMWIVALAACTAFRLPYQVLSLFKETPIGWMILSGIPVVFIPVVLAGLYFSFAGIHIRRPARLLLILIGILNGVASVQGLLFDFAPQTALMLNLPYVILLAIVLPFVLARALRRGNHEAGILLIPAILLSLYVYAKVALVALYQLPNMRELSIQGINLVDNLQFGPFTVSFNVFCNVLSSMALAIILLLRSSRVSRRQAQFEQELAAAQQVQQLLLPGHGQPLPGFSVESVYQPATQVGGDFFQVLCTPTGGLLLVVGDVAGKGLPAAMMVSVIVGAIRTAAEFTSDPAELLAHLNRRLVGRSAGGFSTALAARIGPNGQVEIANAGHLSPYLDGREIELPGALPLGILSPLGYETASFHMPPGSRLVFLSDGVIEARNAKGELFGFARSQALAAQSAEQIARAAVDFGQEDDITVVAVTREQEAAAAA